MDVHSKQSVFVVENESGTVVARGEVPTSTEGMRCLRGEYRLPAGTRVALEPDAHEVRIKAHRPRRKSDGREAFELREGVRRRSYRSIVHVPPLEISRLRVALAPAPLRALGDR